MLYSPSRSLYVPPGPELLPWLTPAEWERGVRPWHKDPRWSPGRLWCPGIDTERQMHALGVIFPGSAQVRREVTTASASVGPGAAPSSFWRLDEASGSRLDTGGTGGNDLSPTNTPGNAVGKIGSALSLNGTTQSVSKSSPTGMTLGTGVSFTIAGWCFPTSLSAGDGSGILCNCNGSVSVGYDLFVNSSGFRAYVGTVSNGRQSLDANGTTPATSTWFQFSMTFDASPHTLTIRINDATQSTKNTTSDIANPSTALQLGTEPLDGSFFPGRIDAVGWWLSLLSAADLTAFYNLGAGTEFYSGAWH